MKIVVLDGFALNPGDLSWDGLESLGACTVYDRTPPAATAERIGDADIILTNKTVISPELLAAKPNLRYVGVLATGYNVVDVRAAAAHGVVVTNVPEYSTPSVAQHVFALLLELCQQVGRHAAAVRAGEWSRSPDFTFRKTPLVELTGKTMGIVGRGRIGMAVGHIAEAFGMRVLCASSRDLHSPELVALYRAADVISLHCPLTDANARMIGADALSCMKPGALLINTARGGLIDDAAVAEALVSGRLGGFGADVLTTEPPDAANPLLTAPNTIITPHIAWAPLEARRRLMDIAVANVRAFLAGNPVNRVN